MYDALTTTYGFSCPTRGEARVRLSRFRRLEELPGPHHPAVYRIDFACGCGDDHAGLVAHDELDLAPLGLEDETTYVNLMTSRIDSVAVELAELAASRIRAGEWPWSFFCWPEERPRPAFPSSFRLLTDAERDRVVVAVLCPVCSRLSVNLVSRAHVDVPFHNDREVGVVEHVFAADAQATLEEFRAELYSSSFDARRLGLGRRPADL
ncbi:MAG TPA: hypothetical protein VFA24_06730 [Gaiellaceae bacterium]|nr:hypothetical protein [Gaiellaceae bacterium]